MLAIGVYLSPLGRTFHAGPRRFAVGDLGKNDHTCTTTTNFYRATKYPTGLTTDQRSSPHPTEWFSTTPYGMYLVDHAGAYHEWKTNHGGVHGSTTQFTVPPTYESAIGISKVGSQEFSPPKSRFAWSTTTMLFEDPVDLGMQTFFVSSPDYLQFYLPACPNYTPDDCQGGTCGTGGECPRRPISAGEYKLTVVGLVSGTDVNSLATGADAAVGAASQEPACPTMSSTSHCADEVDQDLAGYSELIYRTMLDVGSMGEGARVLLSEGEGGNSTLDVADVSATTNIASYTVRCHQPSSLPPCPRIRLRRCPAAADPHSLIPFPSPRTAPLECPPCA